MSVMDPKGIIANKQKDLIYLSTFMMLIIVVPVFVMTFVFFWKYRSGNEKAKYDPNWGHNGFIEFLWWLFPCIIVIVLSVFAWESTHELDPFKPIQSDQKPIQIQVVALQWKWLFIYPEQKIATINFVQFPKETPIQFLITSDAPMNSFWIPQLAGQIYAMPGMRAELNVMADEVGNYRGSSANLSGAGFAGMVFNTKVTEKPEFEAWVESIQSSSSPLDFDSYGKLTAPSSYDPVATYQLSEERLFDLILMKYMGHP